MLYKLVSGLRVVLETMNKSKSFQKWEFYSWRRQIHLLVFKCLLLLLKSFEYSPIIMMDIQIQILYRYSIIYIFSLLVVLLIFLIVANWSLQYVCTAPSPALTKLPTCVLLLALSKSASSTIYCAHIFVNNILCSYFRHMNGFCVLEKCAVNNILCSYFRQQYIVLVWTVSVSSKSAPSAIYTCLQLFLSGLSTSRGYCIRIFTQNISTLILQFKRSRCLTQLMYTRVVL